MWLFTNFGFFSIVQKEADRLAGTLTVRCRVKEDLEELRRSYLSDLGPTIAGAGTDYKYRATVSREALAIATLNIALDINYSNFKGSVAQRQGSGRAHAYSQVWEAVYHLQDEDPVPAKPATTSSERGIGQATSYGGVLFDEDGRVLLRKPRHEYDGYVWTFAKGLNRAGMPPEETALREVKEETGYSAEIIGVVPGVFRGGTGTNAYFLMRPVGIPSIYDSLETEDLRWATPEEAVELIGQTRNPTGRVRDTEVLEAAVTAYRDL